jgi:hypothetical protein
MFKFKAEIVQPVKVDIQEQNIRSFQQSLLLEQKYRALEMIDQANNSLDTKATQLLQASGLIVALVSVLSIPSFVTSRLTHLMEAGIAVAFLVFVLMIGLSILAWSPGKHVIPGSADWNEMYNRYILVDSERCFDQILSDCTEAIESSKSANSRKGDLLKWSASLLVVQIGGLMMIALLA